MVLQGKLLCCLLGYDPRDSIHKSPDVGDVRVCPEIGNPVDGFRAKCRGRDKCIAIPEHDKRELYYLCFIPFQQVMVSDGVIIDRYNSGPGEHLL